MATTKIDPKTGEPYTGISPRDARRAKGREKTAAMSPITRFFGFGQVETHDRKDLEATGDGSYRDRQYPLPG